MELFFQILLSVLAGLGILYTLAATITAKAPVAALPSTTLPGISVLKPLHGAEPALAANLRTIFDQDYGGPVQLIFGARNADDPALTTLAQVRRDFPAADVTVVVDATRHGTNNKVSNILNMAAHLRHPMIAISDSDVAAPPTTLSALAGALVDPGVGIVSCLHAGRGSNGFWSRFAAMDISYRFMPGVMLGYQARLAHPVLGPMMAVRAETLARIGGFARLADVLADDFELGRAVRKDGLRVALTAPFVVHGCGERRLIDVVRHELRWSRTIAVIDRPGFVGSVITHMLPNALLAALVIGPGWTSGALLAAALIVRLVLKQRMDQLVGFSAGSSGLLALRDLLSFVVFLATFCGDSVDWRDSRFRVTTDGKLIPTRPS